MAKEINKIFLLFFYFVVLHIHVQGFDVVLISAELEDISSEYYNPENSFVYVDVDQEPAALVSNIDVIKVLPEHTTLSFSAMGYSMGEYRIPVGMEYLSPLCEVYDETLIIGPAIKALGFVECPPPVGLYVNPGFVPDTTLYPEHFPRNQYQVKLQLKVDDEPVLTSITYVEVL